MKLAVILVSFNTRDLLRSALTSVQHAAQLSSIPDQDIVAVVVDNASLDGSARMVLDEFPQVRLIALPENAGFARANNLALSALGFDGEHTGVKSTGGQPDYVLLLNPDAELVGDALGRMVRFMEEHPAVGACGPRLQYADGAFQHGAFHFPNLNQVALDLLPLHRLPLAARLYDGPINGRYPRSLWDSGAPFPVDFVLGAALLMQGRALQQVGGLDEGYFMYCEEMDWCLRLAKAGLLTYAVPAARVIHHEAQSSRQTPWPSFERLWRSRLRFYTAHREHFPPATVLQVRAMLRLAMRLRSFQAHRRFAQGGSSGAEVAEELAAYARVARM